MSENQNQPQQPPSPAGATPVVFGFIGILIGIPLSYLFQPGLIRTKLTCGQYITKLPQLLDGILKKPDDLGMQILLTLVITCAVTAGIFWEIGAAIAKRR